MDELFTSPSQATNSDFAFRGKYAFSGYYTGDAGFPPVPGRVVASESSISVGVIWAKPSMLRPSSSPAGSVSTAPRSLVAALAPADTRSVAPTQSDATSAARPLMDESSLR
jgi:hypothetical protein